MYVYYYMTILSLYDIERREGRREKRERFLTPSLLNT